MKKILLSILLGASALCANSLADIKQAGEIRIGLQDSQPPFSFDDNGTLKGFEVDLANELVKNLFGNKKIKIDFIAVASKDRVPSLEQNKVDLIISKLTVTKDRVQKVDFSYPYYSVQIGVLSRKDDNISRIDQIAHKKILSVMGTTAEERFKNAGYEIATCTDANECVARLKAGEGIGFADDNTVVLGYARNDAALDAKIINLGKVDYIAVALSKGNTELLDAVNSSLVKMYKAKFFHKAFDEDIKPYYGGKIDKKHFTLDEVYSLF